MNGFFGRYQAEFEELRALGLAYPRVVGGGLRRAADGALRPVLFGSPAHSGVGFPIRASSIASPAGWIRPLRGGVSGGHAHGDTGTLGLVGHKLDGSGPALLMAGHVIERPGGAQVGEPVLQPGRIAGGFVPDDVVGTIGGLAPMQYDPPVALQEQRFNADLGWVEPAREVGLEAGVRGLPGRVQGGVPLSDIEAGQAVLVAGAVSGLRGSRVLVHHGGWFDVDYRRFGRGRARLYGVVLLAPVVVSGDSGGPVLVPLDGSFDPDDVVGTAPSVSRWAVAGLVVALASGATVVASIEAFEDLGVGIG